MEYWVCKKSNDHHNAYGEWVSDFKTLRHLFWLFSNKDDGEAEIWQRGLFEDTNVTEQFKELNRKYIQERNRFINELKETLDLEFEEK